MRWCLPERGNWQSGERLIRVHTIFVDHSLQLESVIHGRVIGEARIFQVTKKLWFCAKQFARLSWTNQCYWGQSHWSAGSEDFSLPRSQTFSVGIHMIMITAAKIKMIWVRKAHYFPSIKIISDCSFSKPMLEILTFFNGGRSWGKTNLILIWN